MSPWSCSCSSLFSLYRRSAGCSVWAAIATTALIGSFGYPVTAAAQSSCWTTVGSAGAVDEADLSQVALNSSDTAILPRVLAGTVDTRYNVVAVPGIFGGTLNSKEMTARIADNGASSRVVLRFIRQNFVTGVSTIVATLDSNAFAPSAVAQARTVSFNNDAPELDFKNNFYFISATLSKLGSSGNPVVRGIRICPRFVVR
ncbi:hypothetical protein [Geminicoccus harenae]|uniref:hypothetical protein n=1 Tax=Geminicoccus harenae TaxID=2498453 RepID=UPI00168A4371|nr:hypothetical protein [Geminicoccus harenae]